MELVSLLFHFSNLLLFFWLSKFSLFDGTVRDGVVSFELCKCVVEYFLLSLQNFARMILSIHCALQTESLGLSSIFCFFKSGEQALVVVLHYFDAMAFIFVRSFISFNLILSILYARLELFLLVIKLVLQGQKMFIKRNAIAQKRFIATRLILLVDFLVFE